MGRDTLTTYNKVTVEEVHKVMKEVGMYDVFRLNREPDIDYSWSDGVYAMAKAIVLERKGVFNNIKEKHND